MDPLRGSYACTLGRGRSDRIHTDGDESSKKLNGLGKSRISLTPAYPLKLAHELLDSVSWGKFKADPKTNLAEEAKRAQEHRLENAQTAREWKNAAEKLDLLEGNDWWKFDEASDECDLQLIRMRLDRLKQANHEGDLEEMLWQIRSSLKRDLGGMCNIRLYQHTWTGTKALIDEYTEVVRYTIDQIAKFCESAHPTDVERFLHGMKAARQSFGTSALLLSGGGTLGMCHIGVISCLLQENLLPRIIAGSSAGSIVGAVLCCKKGDDAVTTLGKLCDGDLCVFQGEGELQGIRGVASNLLKGRSAFNISNLCRVMKELLGDITFKEAYYHTGRILNIHVSCRDEYNLPRLLNYQTSPNVVVWSAVASSCALPGIFKSPGLKAKNPETGIMEPWGFADHRWIDGSIEGDLPAQILERLFNVNNFIVSQVNPHVVPFLQREDDKPVAKASQPGWIRHGLSIARANALYALDNVKDHRAPNFFLKSGHSILSQKYTGDITILPDISWVKWSEVLANPSHEFIMTAVKHGERATWPKLDRIRNHLLIELALDRGIKHIHAMLIGSNRLEQNGAILQRTPSSTRSEHGGQHMRVGSGGLYSPGHRHTRGRQATHRSVRSMIDQSHNHTTMSWLNAYRNAVDSNRVAASDDTRSGRSSPATPQGEEEDLDDHEIEVTMSSPRSQSMEVDRKILAFLSQPNSPSVVTKSSYFDSNPISHTRPPTSPERRKMLTELHMSRAPRTSLELERKRQRN